MSKSPNLADTAGTSAAKRTIKTAAERVKRAGRGRPPLDPAVPTTGMSLRLTMDQRAKVDRLGGAVFLRKCIDNAKDPGVAKAPASGEKAA